MSQTSPDGWAALAADLGDNAFEAKVVEMKPFGAFVETASGIVGLMHVSEWSTPPAVGDVVRVQVIEIDATRQRFSVRPA